MDKGLNLLITLGHNSSAIGLKDGVVIGYEEERLNRQKSSSLFPKQSIEEIFKHMQPEISERGDNVNKIFVSHWYDDFNFHGLNRPKKIHEKIEKHWDCSYVRNLIKKYNFAFYTLSENFTHHDAHAWSVISFFKNHYNKKDIFKSNIIVADGFGNKQEVITVYYFEYNPITKEIIVNTVFKDYGYKRSLGLMYQFATAYTGMKENQDEYKFLGYESNIRDVVSVEGINFINYYVNRFIETNWNSDTSKIGNIDTGFIDLSNVSGLGEARSYWYNTFNCLLDFLYNEKYLQFDYYPNEYQKRIIIGFFIQSIIEKYHIDLLKNLNLKNILVAGGIYYNVKLNNTILKSVDNFCIVPLAGDQGTAIGLYERYVGDFPFKNLLWGKRKEEISEYSIENKDKFIEEVVNSLCNDDLVNVVYGAMEFGPRALCHTSTLALPYNENVKTINAINKRSTVMPMAPVMLRKNANFLFSGEEKKVIGSDKYMIITYDYNRYMHDTAFNKILGVAHKYPLDNLWSGRPQVIEDDDDSIIGHILRKMDDRGVKCLINTSYNIHGSPIVYTQEDAIKDFQFQLKMKEELKIDQEIKLFVSNLEN